MIVRDRQSTQSSAFNDSAGCCVFIAASRLSRFTRRRFAATNVRPRIWTARAETSFNPGNGYGAFSTSDQATLTYVQGTSTSPSTLVWYDREGNSTPIDGDPATFFDLRLSPDDSRAVAAMLGQDSGTGEIWTINLDRGVRTRLAFGGWYHTDPLWSPEGERVLYTSQENGSLEFYTRRADGTGQQQAFFQTGADKVLYDWSRDGSYVAFSDLERGGASLDVSIYYVDRDEQSPYLEGGSTFTNARFSPDSRWIAYESDVSGETEVFVQSFDETGESARRWQVSTVGGSRPHWRVDGREIVYRGRDNHIVAVSVEPRAMDRCSGRHISSSPIRRTAGNRIRWSTRGLWLLSCQYPIRV